ncbi:MAG: RecX family transcriptional regulator [Bacteroidia bacterium]|nr:RecX family transcriptional regulator [Bacteroidia bacterium]
MDQLSENRTYKEALTSLERFCAYQERCILEVRQKLKDFTLSEEDKLALIDQLTQSDLLNEDRFAIQYARGKFRIKEWGKVRIQGQLRSKKIAEDSIRTAIDQLDPVEYKKVFEGLAKRKLEGIKTKDVQLKRKKLADLLSYRGWEFELVYDKVRELIPFT